MSMMTPAQIRCRTCTRPGDGALVGNMFLAPIGWARLAMRQSDEDEVDKYDHFCSVGCLQAYLVDTLSKESAR